MTEVDKILIIRLSSFGDIVLTFPLINIIKKKYPNSHITFLVKKKYAGLVMLNPYIDEAIIYNETDGKNNSLKGYDVVLDLQNNVRSRMLTKGLSNVFRFRKNNFKKFLLVKFKINLLKDTEPVYKRYIRAAEIPLSISEKEMEYSTTTLKYEKNSKVSYPYIVLAPSSRHFTKTYPREKFVEYINSHPENTYALIGDMSDIDREICAYISEHTGNTENLCGELSYSELAGIIAGSEKVICNDSGILHLSEVLGKQVISVFGSTVKEFGFFPQLQGSIVHEIKGLKCRPCSHIGLPECPLGHFKCMKEINPNRF